MATMTAGRARTANKPARVAKKVAPARKKVARAAKRPAPPAQAMARKTIDPGWTWDDSLPLAQARQIGNTIYVSGQVAYDATGQLVGAGDFISLIRQLFRYTPICLARA